MTRTEKSLKNLMFAVVGQAAGVLISFVSRKVFLLCLDETYLGISGLFTNILTVLSLAELGIGEAMSFSLYKPLAENDTEKIKSLMLLYKRAYTAVGCSVLILAALFTPFYRLCMNEVPDIPDLTLIYLLYAANTGVSYFLIYKRALIICDQKRYIATFYRYGMYFLLNCAQIAILLATKNYVLFMAMQVAATIIENILVSKTADKLYPYLKDKDIAPLAPETFNEIKQNIKALLLHKIGGIAVNATDNILLSKLVNIVSAGIYSNYFMITNALTTIILQVFNSMTASIGNLNASEDDKTSLITSFYRVFFLDFWIYGFCLCCLMSLFNPFISLWLDTDKLLFDDITVTLICLSFFIMGMRRSVLIYRETAGVYRPDRFKSPIEAVTNLLISYFMAKAFGPAGVFAGTVISMTLCCVWLEPLVLYKYVFKSSAKPYFIRLGIYTAVSFAACGVTVALCSLIPDVSVMSFIGKMCICLCTPNLIFFAIFRKTDEFRYFFELAKKIITGKLIKKAD